MLKNRTLALLLSLTMLMTFMPAMAFAEETADDASEQPAAVEVEDAAEEAVVDEAAEESEGEMTALDSSYEEEVKPTSIEFIPASDFEFKTTEGRTDLGWDLAHKGNVFKVGYSDGNYKTFEPVEYEVNDGSQPPYYTRDWFQDGDTGKESLLFRTEVNGEPGSAFKAGENKIRFAYGYDPVVYTEYFTVTADVKPVAIDFVPADGVTFWGYETDTEIDGEAFFTAGNKFIVTYSDGNTKSFTFRTVEYEDGGEKVQSSWYYEDGAVIDADYIRTKYQSFAYNIPEGELKRGDNEIRFGLQLDGGDRLWTTKTYNAVGKPYAVSMSFYPNPVEAEITRYHDDLFIDIPGNYFTVNYVDGSTKIFQFCIKDGPEKGIIHSGFFCGDEELSWGKDDIKLQEGPNPLTVYVYGLRPRNSSVGSGTLKYDMTVVAAKEVTPQSRHSKHTLTKVAATKATCQEKGVKAHYECSVCHKLFTDKKGKKETTYAKLATKTAKHVFKKKIISDEYLKSPATCTKKAVYYYACKTCGEHGKKTFTSGKALGHKYEQSLTKATPGRNGSIGQKCTVCGKKGKTKVIPKASKIAVVKKYKKKGVPESALAGGKFIEVKNSKGKKIAAAEYEISFENNVEAGTGAATINFVGANYEGTKTVNYKIAK